jgi:uncharacterized protein (DUF1330 family)
MKRLFLAAAFLSACSQSDVPQTGKTESTDPIGAYMIVQGKGYAPAELGPYAASLPPIYAKYGGRYVSFDTDFDVAEGSYDAQAIIISAWPSAEAARAFWDSPEYREAIKLRDGIGTFDVVIVDALPAP